MFNPLKYPICLETPRRLSGTSAWERHIPFAFGLMDMHRPRLVVELGTHTGDSYCAFCQAVAALELDARCRAVDHWLGDEHSGKYEGEVYEELKAYHDPLYGAFSELLMCTFDEARDRFADESIDLLHIDALHTYEAVRHDFESWLPKMSVRGVVLLHDTDVRDRGFGVWKLWDELKGKYPSFEFKHGYGLGVLGVGQELPPPVRALLECTGNEARAVDEFFSQLGHRVALSAGWSVSEVRVTEARARSERLEAERARAEARVAALEAERARAEAQMAALEAERARAEARVAALEAERARAEARVAALEAERARVDAQMAALEAERADLRQWREIVLRSRSWRITAPLRWLAGLARGVYAYYRIHGLAPTVQKVAKRLLGRQTAAEEPHAGRAAAGRIPDLAVPADLAVAYRPGDIIPLGPITSADAFLQEIPLDADFISSCELLLTAYGRRNTSLIEILLLSERGDVLHRDRFTSQSVAEGGFRPLRLPVRLDLPKSGRLYLLLRSPNGTRTNGVAAWQAPKGLGALHRVSNTPALVEDGHISLPSLIETGSRLEGSVIVRIGGGKWIKRLSYRRPPRPPAFDRLPSLDRTRVVIVTAPEGTPVSPPLSIAALLQQGGVEVSLATPADAIATLEAGLVEVLILGRVSMNDTVRRLLRAARTVYVPTVALCDEEIRPDVPPPESIASTQPAWSTPEAARLLATFRACDFAWCTTAALCTWSHQNEKSAYLVAPPARPGDDGDHSPSWALREVLRAYRRRHRPKLTIVSILHGKADQIEAVLWSYCRQSYEGEVEVILVDDASPDDSVALVTGHLERARGSGEGRIPDVRIIRNEQNLGNCVSRNVGVAHATGDVIIVVDADCLLSHDFLEAHADAHSFDDCDVVLGPVNLETHGRPPTLVLEEYERWPERVERDAIPQDPLNKRSFLNCVTRNFSVKTAFLTEELFDPVFSYSRQPESGFGWEDVEMGYRLYRRGARIKYVARGFTVHASHPSQVDEGTKPLRSLRNYRRLFDKHPELLCVARRWSLATYESIGSWLASKQVPVNEDRRALDEAFARFLPPPFYLRSRRRLRVLTYRWHVPHQYELFKLPYEFTLVTDLGTHLTRTWDLGQRPLPDNVRLAPIEDVRVSDYDLAILPFDENVRAPENTNGVIGPDWGLAFQWCRHHLKLPKIAICHGTPQFYGQYDLHYRKANLLQPIEAERQGLVDFLSDVLVVTNSYQAEREWGFKRSRVIWHGFDPTEFPPATYEKGILSPIGPLMLSRPHYRGYFLYREVLKEFPTEHMPRWLHVPEPDVMYDGNEYAVAKFQHYVRALRRYSVYFNPTLRSPMPRGRGEAMMCGLAAVSAWNHDAELFVKNGVNGFYSDDPMELRDYLLYLVERPDRARTMGEQGRRTALDLFNHDRYLQQWEDTISAVLRGES